MESIIKPQEPRKSVAVLFVNWTDKDFTHKWDSVEYTFKAGQSQYLQDYLANHFAKHLAQRECNRRNLLFSDRQFKVFFDKCTAGEAIEAESPLKLEIDIKQGNKKEKRFCDQCDSKGVRHKKDCPTLKKETAEDNFEGLEDETTN